MKKYNDVLRSRVFDKFKQINLTINGLDIEKISLDKLKANHNEARMQGEADVIIRKMVESIKNGQYDPYSYVPPIVEKCDDTDEQYTIISGHHRYLAHRASNEDEMLCVVVKFENEYDRHVWRIAENQGDFDGFFKNISDEENTISSIVRLISLNSIPGDRKSIEKFLLDTKTVTKKAKVSLNRLTNKIIKKVDSGNVHDYVKTWESKEKNIVIENLKKKYPNRKFVSQTFKEKKDVDYDLRVIHRIVDSFIEDPTRQITLVYSVNEADKNKIEHIRDFKPGYLIPSYVERCRKVVELHDKGYDLNDLVSLEPLPQFGSEISNDDAGMNKFYSDLENKYSSINQEVVEQIVTLVKNSKDDVELQNQIKKLLSASNKESDAVNNILNIT